MALLPIVKYGNPILRKKIADITDFSNFQPLIDNMLETMYAAEGIGLAANQVNKDLNLFCLEMLGKKLF